MKATLLLFSLTMLCGSLLSQSPGSLDPSFDPNTSTNALVESVAIQPDGKILIGGPFSDFNGTAINGIARLNADGTLDNTFDPGDGVAGIVQGQQYHVYAIVVQPDGKIILGGAFHNFDNTSRDRIVRLNADGSLDATFDPGNGADGTIRAMELQNDGKLIIGGSFNYYNGSSTPFIARINADGSEDNTFDPGSGANSAIQGLTIQNDGKVVVVGDFTDFNGASLNRIARLNTDGSLDGAFNPGTGSGGTFPSIRDVEVQNDGKIVISGYFDEFDGTTRKKIARLNANGSLDASFDPGAGADLNAINKLEILANNSIMLVGGFYTYDGTSRNSIARINSDGSLDVAFDPGFGCNNTGEALAIQSDGKVVIGGNFGQYDGTQRIHIARAHNDIGPSSIDDIAEELLTVYPNPSNGIYHINGPVPMVEHCVTDLKGVMVQPWSTATTIDLSEVDAGIYLLRSTSGRAVKLVKQ